MGEVRHDRHLFNRVKLSAVVPTSKLEQIALHMLHAELMIRSNMPAFQHRPEALNAIRVRHAVNVLFCGMIHGVMLVSLPHQAFVSGILVTVDRCAFRDEFTHKPL